MANINRSILTSPIDWATTDLSYVLDDGEQGFYYNADDGTFYLIGDGTSTLTQLYTSTGIMGGTFDSTNFDARITALIGSSTKGIVDQKNGYRGSLATNPTSSWSAGTYLPGAVVEHEDLYFYMFNSTSSTTEPALETEWEISPDIQTGSKWSKSITTAGMGSLSDPKSSDFKNYYKIGEYEQNGTEFDLFRINVAGQVTSTSATDFYKLVDASDIKAKFATFDTDHYELEDYRGVAVMSGDESGGYREANGTMQPHATQHITGDAASSSTQGIIRNADPVLNGVFVDKEDVIINSVDTTTADGTSLGFDNAGQTGQTYNVSGDGLGNEGSDPGETFPNNVADGCLCVHVFIERGEITSISG